MAKTQWALKGDYFETCSCDYLCPCILTRMEAEPTGGECKVSMVFRIKKGNYGKLALDGLSFAVLGHTPGPMGDGNWRVGLVIDETASAKQAEALGMMAPLVGVHAGSVRGRFEIEKKKMSFSINVPGVLEQHGEGVESLPAPGQPIYIDNAGHPANTRLALARGTRSRVHALGIDWDDVTRSHNAHFAPFNWASA